MIITLNQMIATLVITRPESKRIFIFTELENDNNNNKNPPKLRNLEGSKYPAIQPKSDLPLF